MKLTKDQRRALRKALHTLAQTGPIDARLGICYNLNALVRQGRDYIDTYDFVGRVSVNWPGLTGKRQTARDGRPCCAYPIAREYDDNEFLLPLWEGSQLEQRVSLIDFLIDWLGRPLPLA